MTAEKYATGWSLRSSKSDPPLHAVPMDAKENNATSLCGVTELVVFVDGGERHEFNAADPWSCKRCARKVQP